eukprot:5794451-Amphidinium_carterae.1
MIRVAEMRSKDDCHTAVMAEFETGRVRLESAVSTAQMRICDALSLGEEAVDDFEQLKIKFNETSQLLTGPCVEMSSKSFQQIVHEAPNPFFPTNFKIRQREFKIKGR